MLPPSPPPMAPHLDSFRMHLSSDRWIRRAERRSNHCKYAASDRWICHALRRSLRAVTVHASNIVVRWITPPQHLTRISKLHLVRVAIMAEGFFDRLGNLCPVLEELHVEGCRASSLRGIASPTLVRLVVIGHRGSVISSDLIHATPRLASLRLELTYDAPLDFGHALDPSPLASVAEASIRIAVVDRGYELKENYWGDWVRKKNLEFLSSTRALLARLPNAATLHLSGFTTRALLDEASQEFATLYSLRSLLLEDCDVGMNFHALASILRNTPNLEKLALHHCKFVGIPVSKGYGATRSLRREKLESIETKSRRDEPRLLHLLSEVSKGMPLEQWQRIRKSNELVV
ncbi:unnamed protein product [Alopecurus aequalis]